jgi:hypothetical protein
MPSLMDDVEFLDELDKLEVARPGVEAVPAPSRAPLRLETARHGTPSPALETVDETVADLHRQFAGEDSESERLVARRRFEDAGKDYDAPQPAVVRGVPRLAAVLFILVCTSAGGASAAFVFRSQVAQIVTAWTGSAR